MLVVGPSAPPNIRRQSWTAKHATIDPARPAIAGVMPAMGAPPCQSRKPPTMAMPVTIAANASAVAARRLNRQATIGTNKLTP